MILTAWAWVVRRSNSVKNAKIPIHNCFNKLVMDIIRISFYCTSTSTSSLRSETINKRGCFVQCTHDSKRTEIFYFNLYLQKKKTNRTKKSFRRLSCEEVAKHQYLLSEVTSTLRNDPAMNSYSSVRQSMNSFSSVRQSMNSFSSVFTVFKKSLTVLRQFLQFLKKKFNSYSSVFTAFLWS